MNEMGNTTLLKLQISKGDEDNNVQGQEIDLKFDMVNCITKYQCFLFHFLYG